MAVNLDEINKKMANMKTMFKNEFPQACEELEKKNIVHDLSKALKEASDKTPPIPKNTAKGRDIS